MFLINSAIVNPWDDLEDLFEDLEINPSATKSKSSNTIDNDNCIRFPWQNFDEPQDIHRNIDLMCAVDLQYYGHFIAEFETKCNVFSMMNKVDPLDKPIDPVIDADMQCIDLLLLTPDTPTTGPQQRDLLAALTSTSSGDVFDGERLEVLGDAFLKFSASIFLMQHHPEWHEGFLSTCKGQMVSNRNLYYLGNELVAGKLKVFLFNPKVSWKPPMMCVPNDLKVYFYECALS